jgi:hypothetical protein
VYLYVHRYWKHLKQGKYSPPTPRAAPDAALGGLLGPAEAGT